MADIDSMITFTEEELFDIVKAGSKQITAVFRDTNRMYLSFGDGNANFLSAKTFLTMKDNYGSTARLFIFVSNDNTNLYYYPQLRHRGNDCEISMSKCNKQGYIYKYTGIFNFETIRIWSKLFRDCPRHCEGLKCKYVIVSPSSTVKHASTSCPIM